MTNHPEIYLDNAATTRPHAAVVEAMQRVLTEDYGNPSSLHGKGLAAERLVAAAREAVARSLGVTPEEIIFTCGGTEANNLAIHDAIRLAGRHHVIATAIEHSSVLEPIRRLTQEGFEVTELPVDREGRVTAAQVTEAIRPETVLVSIMAVNNEIGTVQPIEEIARAIHQRSGDGRRIVFHVDGVQAWGKIRLQPVQTGIDLLSVSGHKVHGPKGAGVLYIRRGVRLPPLFFGGEQERGIRPGTENVPGIAGLGVAAARLSEGLDEAATRMQSLKARLLEQILEIPDVRVNSPTGGSAPHILNVAFPGIRGETLLHRLEMDGVFVSTGSACHSRTPTPSHVLLAIGLPPDLATSSLRFSLSRFTTSEEIDAAAVALRLAVPELRALVR